MTNRRTAVRREALLALIPEGFRASRTSPRKPSYTPCGIARPVPMPSVESLREIKRAEEEVARLRAKAKEDADRILREAARDAENLRRQADEEAQRSFDQGIEAARREVEREKAQVHARGEQEAKAIAARGQGAALGQAIDALLRKFDQRLRG